MTPVIARRPHHDDKAFVQKPYRHETWLSIVVPIIATGVLPPSSKDQLGIGKIEIALGQRLLPLRLVLTVRHLMYPQKTPVQDKL
jgi:hypothetical protein